MKKIYIRLQTKATTKITYIYIYISWYKTKTTCMATKKIIYIRIAHGIEKYTL